MLFGPKVDLLPSEFREKLSADGGVVVDCRTPMECAEGTWPGAVQADWNAGAFEEKSTAWDKGQPIYCYCRSGARSGAAAKFLRSQGFESVFNVGGYSALNH